jgi:AMIN domain
MHRSPPILPRQFAATLCAFLFGASSFAQVAVRSVKVLGAKDAVEIEVEATDRIVPQTRVLTGPDRLVVDFPNAVPGGGLRSQSVDRGEVKDVRVGLFQSRPPVTRVVLDLKTSQSYQIFPYGRTVMIKVMGGGPGAQTPGVPGGASATGSGLVAENYTTETGVIRASAPVQPTLVVSYRDGLLGIRADKATLSDVLTAIQQRTGAEISMAAGTEQEQVAADIEAAPAPEVLAHLLNGSKFNFLILSSPTDSRLLDKVILSERTQEYVAPLAMPENDPNAQNLTSGENPPIADAPVEPPAPGAIAEMPPPGPHPTQPPDPPPPPPNQIVN